MLNIYIDVFRTIKRIIILPIHISFSGYPCISIWLMPQVPKEFIAGARFRARMREEVTRQPMPS